MICFLAIQIKPVPKLRHRDRRVWLKGLHQYRRIRYTPAKTVHFEAEIKKHAKAGYSKPASTKALRVTIHFSVVQPKSSKNKFPVVKPDLDNYVKSVLDGLNGIVWKDDSQVCELLATKKYSKSKPLVTIMVEELDQEPDLSGECVSGAF